jgi:alpha-beta hydrolase superfamily lysophospholipase
VGCLGGQAARPPEPDQEPEVTDALRRFLTPPAAIRNLRREDEILGLAKRGEFVLEPGTENPQERITFYRWPSSGKGDPERRILLFHGWGGKAAQFFAFIPELQQRGFSVVAFDAPGHGNSGGEQTSGPAFARASLELVRRVGPVDGLVAHCLGAMAAAIALAQGLLVRRVVMLAPLAYILPTLEIFIERENIRPKVAEGLRRRFLQRYEERALDLPNLARNFRMPGLVLADPADPEVPRGGAEATVTAWPRACLQAVDKAGHWRILRDRGAIEMAGDFLMQG